MRVLETAVLSLLTLPLAAQAWDLRVEVPFPQGQNLPQTLIEGTGQLVQKKLGTGSGYILSASHRIVRVGPVLKLEWGAEYAHLETQGQVQSGAAALTSRLRQDGIGLGLNAQFWVPFTGLAGELGVMERFQSYRLDLDGQSQDHRIARPWLRVGLRWNLPMPVFNPYLAASYQQPITKDHPVRMDSASDLASYVGAQGTGQEFQRLWTFGVGITF